MRAHPRPIPLRALALALLLSSACNDSSPTAPELPPRPSALTIVISDPNGALAGREDAIRQWIQDIFDTAARQISVSGTIVTVTTDLGRVIPGWGVGGFTLNAANVELAVDPRLDDALLAQRLPQMAAHELHHVARYRGPGYGQTLLEALVSEGLADHYAVDLLAIVPPWSRALSASDLELWLERAREELDSPGYDHGAWFIGRGTMPVWAGYSIGFELVSRYRAAHPGATAASLVDTPAEAFRPR